jgi:proline iminopeptidase
MILDINGAKLFVDVQGQGPAIIAHHGAPGMGSHATPKRALAPLADSHTVITFDARGSGQSEKVGPYTHEQWVADVDAIRAHFGFETFILKGGSYGGFIALEYVLAHPERVSHLILRDTAAANDHQVLAKQNALARAREFPDITREVLDRMFAGEARDDDDFRRIFEIIAPLFDFNYDPERTAARIAQSVVHAEAHNYAFKFNLPNYDLRGRLHEIAAPTLVTVGRHDWIMPVSASEVIANGIRNAEFVVFEHSGHSPGTEENDRWIATIREFLARHPSMGR